MLRHLGIMALGLALVLAASARPAQADDDLRAVIRDEIKAFDQEKKEKAGSTMSVKWKNGLNFESADKQFKAKIGGRVMWDLTFVDDDDFERPANPLQNTPWTNLNDRFFPRRLRLYNSGQIGKHVEYKLQITFAGDGGIAVEDAYLGVNNLRECFGCGFPDVRIGHFKEPFGLEELTSSKYITFIERSAPTNAFAPGRSPGVMIHDSFEGDRLGYAAGVFGNGTAGYITPTGGSAGAIADLSADGIGFTGRVWGTPWYDCNCPSRFLHLGAGASYRIDPEDVRFRARPATGYGNRLIDTDYSDLAGHRAGGPDMLAFDMDSVFVWNGEAALVYGPFSVQGEFFSATAKGGAGDFTFTGWYVQGSYWLTGEYRPYKKGSFHRVKPCCDFLDKDCCCKGAIELAARYSTTDLNDGFVTGGKMNIFTVGVNWHLNENARIMVNFSSISAEVNEPGPAAAIVPGPVPLQLGGPAGLVIDETMTVLNTRFQVDF